MTFDVLQARSVEDVPDPNYPNPGPGPNSYVTESDDGHPLLVPVTAVIAERVSNGGLETGRAEKISGLLAVTDSRVVFSCTEFRTGGGWRGYGGLTGPLLGMAMNAASEARAVSGTRGFTLVGHVRYSWLAAVVAHERRQGAPNNAIKFTFVGPVVPPTVFSLTVYLEKRRSPTELATEVVRRATIYNIAHTQGQLHDQLVEFSKSDQRAALKSGHGVSWRLPR